MSTETKLRVTEIQRFCMHDGPGLRTTVFLKGCPLRCAWCHNPETQRTHQEILFYANKCIGCRLCESKCAYNAHSFGVQHLLDRKACVTCGACAKDCPTAALELCGKELTIDEIVTEIERDRAFFGNNGGVTLSGGEPLMHGEGAVALLKACKARGLTTAVETCGFVDADILCAAIPFVDFFLWDVKDTDDERHKRYTGVSNKKILENLISADTKGAKTRLRCILVAGVNTNEAHYHKVAKIASSLQNCEGVEWIPYHAYGGTKATFLGGEDNGRKNGFPRRNKLRMQRKF